MSENANPEAKDFREVRAVLDQAVRDLAALGAEIVDPICIPRLSELLNESRGTNYETDAAMKTYLAAHPRAPVKTLEEIVLCGDVIRSRRASLMGRVGRTTNEIGYLQQLLARQALQESVLAVMANERLDTFIYATFDHQPVLIPPDPRVPGQADGQRGNNRLLSSMTGFPAITVPAGFTSDGMPVGVEFMGRAFTEGLLLNLAHSFEQATRHRVPPKTTPPLKDEP
jgi:Asp-tRNA(Asn)/Glu-tRNA(Gln) amidotransferase A subunit family amidase